MESIKKEVKTSEDLSETLKVHLWNDDDKTFCGMNIKDKDVFYIKALYEFLKKVNRCKKCLSSCGLRNPDGWIKICEDEINGTGIFKKKDK